MAKAKPKCRYGGCGGSLRFAGVTTKDGMGRAQCEKCGKPQWKQGLANIADSGWRLTLPAGRFTDADLVEAMLPESGRATKEAFAALGSLPPPWRVRRGQQGMGYGVALALGRDMVLLANAGVGVGKTFSYLLPILQRLKRNPTGTAVISTRTILLQHQLMDDIAEAQKIVGTKIPVRVIKGQNQYLCMRKLQDVDPGPLPTPLLDLRFTWADQHEQLVEKHAAGLREITRAVQGKGGIFGQERQERVYSAPAARREAERAVSGPDFDEAAIDRRNFEDAKDDVWRTIQVDEDSPCKECKWRTSCGFYRMRSDRQQFQGILIVNHGLLARDIFSRLNGETARGGGLWPAPFVTIVDEAHWIEEHLRREGALSLRPGELKRVTEQAVSAIQGAGLRHGRKIVQAFDAAARDLYRKLVAAVEASEREQALRMDSDEMQVQPFRAVEGLAQALAAVLKHADDIVDLLILAHGDSQEDDITALLPVLRRLAAWAKGGDTSAYVTWLERKAICVGDLDLSQVTDALTQRATVFASGTLGIGDDFTFIERSLGLDKVAGMERRLLRLYAPSPFDYQRQMRYVLATNLPDPRRADLQGERVRALAAAIRAITVRHFRVLVLFTSRRQLYDVRDLLGGIPNVLTEGDASAAKLAEKFRALQFGVYLSTSSWDGLDAPGTGAVIIAQVPYPVPGDPWVEAKCRIAEERGENKFDAIITPMMQMRMLQGVGRMIRRETDEGTVYVLDPRAAERFDLALRPVLPTARAQQEAV